MRVAGGGAFVVMGEDEKDRKSVRRIASRDFSVPQCGTQKLRKFIANAGGALQAHTTKTQGHYARSYW